MRLSKLARVSLRAMLADFCDRFAREAVLVYRPGKNETLNAKHIMAALQMLPHHMRKETKRIVKRALETYNKAKEEIASAVAYVPGPKVEWAFAGEPGGQGEEGPGEELGGSQPEGGGGELLQQEGGLGGGVEVA